MKYRIWSILLRAASLRHRDPEHRQQLRRLSEELRDLERATPAPGGTSSKATSHLR